MGGERVGIVDGGGGGRGWKRNKNLIVEGFGIIGGGWKVY